MVLSRESDSGSSLASIAEARRAVPATLLMGVWSQGGPIAESTAAEVQVPETLWQDRIFLPRGLGWIPKGQGWRKGPVRKYCMEIAFSTSSRSPPKRCREVRICLPQAIADLLRGAVKHWSWRPLRPNWSLMWILEKRSSHPQWFRALRPMPSICFGFNLDHQ